MSRTAAPRARKGAGTPPLIVRTLREDLGFAQAPPAAGSKRVDRQQKIIYGVKMGGLESPNRHGVDGVEGTTYERAAVERALHLYEGLPGFADHPPRDKAAVERSIKDALGIYRNVRMGQDGWYGDFHLVPSHALCESILDVAERDELAGLYSISHNADGKGVVRGKRYVVTEIVEVRSCDVVTRGATTTTFFESKEGTRVKRKLLETVAGSKLPAKLKAVMLEMDTMDAEYEEGGDWKDHLVAGVGALVKSDSEEDHAKAKKILALLEPEKAEDLEEDEEPAKDKDKDEEKPKDKDEEKKAVEESRELASIYGLGDRKALVESLAKLPDTKARIAILKELKGTAGDRTGNKPPPGAPRTVAESAEPGIKYADLLTTPLY